MTQPNLTDEQKIEIVTRHTLKESIAGLARAFNKSPTTISKVIKKAVACGPPLEPKKPQLHTPSEAIKKFTSRARKILWRENGGKIHKAYEMWEAKVKDLQENSEMDAREAIVQASKDFTRLETLFREYDVSEYDPAPDSHPHILKHGQKAPVAEIENEEKDQTHRENLAWAIEAAGRFLRTRGKPTTCPNDKAYYLFRQACDEPKDFLGKYTQIEAKGGGDPEEDREKRKSGKKSIMEIEEMLQTLTEDPKGESE